MTYHIFFGFAAGISKTIKAPVDTKQKIQDHIDYIESSLNIKREKYLDNPEHWESINFDHFDDDILCDLAIRHNNWVRDTYWLLEEYANTPAEVFEEITDDEFKTFLPALKFIDVPSHKWTGEYYTDKMETLYEVMRGRETNGISFNSKKLTQKQAAAVIILFSEFLDHDDRRLDVPKGHDYLASSYNGGYDWCEKCGAITFEDSQRCERKKCPQIIVDEN